MVLPTLWYQDVHLEEVEVSRGRRTIKANRPPSAGRQRGRAYEQLDWWDVARPMEPPDSLATAATSADENASSSSSVSHDRRAECSPARGQGAHVETSDGESRPVGARYRAFPDPSNSQTRVKPDGAGGRIRPVCGLFCVFRYVEVRMRIHQAEALGYGCGIGWLVGHRSILRQATNSRIAKRGRGTGLRHRLSKAPRRPVRRIRENVKRTSGGHHEAGEPRMPKTARRQPAWGRLPV
jgi:hypothetical protein